VQFSLDAVKKLIEKQLPDAFKVKAKNPTKKTKAK